MKTEKNSKVITERELTGDVIVVGGGLSGVCAAVSAARHGAKVILVQDRPMLGGNASSECRMGIMGAHGDENKETGLLEELQLDNIYRNPLMRYTLWDDAILSLVLAEPNITLLLNTSVQGVQTAGDTIQSVTAWNCNEYAKYTLTAKLFADCSGDGILRLSGAEFRIGREAAEEFGEQCLHEGDDDKTMGNSILLQLRHADEHRPFIPPPWAHTFTDEDFAVPESELKDGKIHSYKRPYPDNNNFWWIEYGGNLDTIADAGDIQRELKAMAYGVWAYMKNHPDGRCKDYELDWIGSLPGKRESTRFIGDHILTQQEILDGGKFHDVVAYGGWTLDDHHPDAFYRRGYLSTHLSPPSPFGIPFRCLYSKNIRNLMFAGRNVSCTHLGMSATRVMATCALMGQAVGTAAALATKYKTTPRDIGQSHLQELQTILEDDDVMLPGRWRTVSQKTRIAKTSTPQLQNGIDRFWKKQDNGAWIAPGEFLEYYWDSPQDITGYRLIFDSELSFQGKRMRKLEALKDYKPMPPVLIRDFHLDAWIDGQWKTIATASENFHRLVRINHETITTNKIRLVADKTWGAPKAHVFAWDVI